MEKKRLSPKNFTQIMGAYSHGLQVNIGDSDLIFVTGQIAMDEHGNAVSPESISEQADFIFKNIQSILVEAETSLDDVVKAVIYITDMDKYKEVSEIRNKYFKNSKPVSTLIEINRTVKEGCDIEIEVIAIKKKQIS